MKAPPNTSVKAPPLSLQILVDPTSRRHSIPSMHARCIYKYAVQYNYNEARERSEPFFPWFSKEKKASS